MEYSSEGVLTALGTGITALITGGLWLRGKLRSDKVEQASANSTEQSLKVNDTVLANLQKELDRLGERVGVLEKQVTHLTEKLANVRLIALDCYQLATECDCENTDSRNRLLEHLKAIIKEA